MTSSGAAAPQRPTSTRAKSSTRAKGASAKRRTSARTPFAFSDEWPGFLGWAFLGAVAMTVLFGIVPYIVVGIVGLVAGTFPSSDQGGIYGTAAGYPFFQPPFWLLWIPALIMLVLSVVTIPMPSKLDSLLFSARADLAVFAFLGFTVTLAAVGAFGGPQAETLLWACAVWLVAVALFTIRGAVDWTIGLWRLWHPQRGAS